jgi:hypothetical protein
MAEDSDDEYTIPLAYPAPYGAGIRKKGIKFVSAGTIETSNNAQTPSGDDIANSYLALVLDRPSVSNTKTSENVQREELAEAKCQICNLPLNDGEGMEHHISLAHQVALTHIYPPSAIDRTRKGLTYLESHGWDPDSRKGLGAEGEGILAPIHTTEKKDKAGIGGKGRGTKSKGSAVKAPKGPQGLDRNVLKKLEQQRAKRGKRLHDMFYTNDEVAKYLGEDA